jgi:outer membrane protein assembly factor BamE (lipoprotein component of BamABCDE complex)
MKYTHKNCMFRILVAAGLVASLSACVIIPIPMPSKTQANYVEREDIRFIRKGTTTKTEVREQLGEPSQTLNDPVRWVYTLRKFTGNRWAACIFVGGPYAADGDCGMVAEGRTKFRILEVEFDEEGIVDDKDTYSIVEGKCKRPDICEESGAYTTNDPYVTRTDFVVDIERD